MNKYLFELLRRMKIQPDDWPPPSRTPTTQACAIIQLAKRRARGFRNLSYLRTIAYWVATKLKVRLPLLLPTQNSKEEILLTDPIIWPVGTTRLGTSMAYSDRLRTTRGGSLKHWDREKTTT